MTSEESIFAEALAKGSALERAAYLDRSCAGDPQLRRQVEALLLAHQRPAGILELPPRGSAATTESTPFAEGIGSLIGPYKLLEQIGGGGMGVVYMAEQLHPVRRKVALKIIKPGMDSGQVIARFEAERQALTMMDHPNIAKVLDAGTTNSGRPYFVMELVKGIPITDYCDQAQLSTRHRLELFIQVCHAVQHAHQKGVIHRDIKPTNVLVTLHDDKPVPKVIDFGIAKATGHQLTERTLFTGFAQMMGTPLYMSPEQAQISGLDVDTRSDIYSLGVMLYELLTGTTPFDKQRLVEAAYDEVRRIIREEDPPKPSTRLSTLRKKLTSISAHRHTDPKKLGQLMRGELDWIVMKALEKDRSRRYETANSFAMDVQRYLADEAVHACPPSAGYRLRKFARRNRGPVLVTAVVMLALLGGVVGTTLGMLRARKAEREARDARGSAERERDAAVEARIATFDALIDLTDFTDRYLLLEHRVSSAAEREFLQRMVKLYERQAATLSDAAGAGGQTHVQLGDYARSLDGWRQAADLYRSLPAANPADPATPRSNSLAQARQCRAVALTAEKLRRWPEAVEFSRRQLEFARAAIAPGEQPDQELFNLLLTGNWCLTLSLMAAGQFDEALSPWEEMVRLIAWSEPGGINDGFCEHLSRIAAKLTAAGKTADAAVILAPGMAERRAKLTANPDATEMRIDLRRAYRALGLIHEESRKFQNALDAFEQIMVLGEAPPDSADFQVKKERYLVFGALVGRAVCLDALGREADAEASWQAMYTFTGRSAASWFVIRVTHLARNGQPERAVGMAEKTFLRAGTEDRYRAACVYAIASADLGLSPGRKEEFASRAIGLLEEANAAGLFIDPSLVAHTKTDPDLDPVRGRDDFKKLLAKLEAGKGR